MSYENWLNDLKSMQRSVLMVIRDGLRADYAGAKRLYEISNDRFARRLTQMNNNDIEMIGVACGSRLMLSLDPDKATEGLFMRALEDGPIVDVDKKNASVSDWMRRHRELQSALLMIYRDALRNNLAEAVVMLGIKNVRAAKVLVQFDYGNLMRLQSMLGFGAIFKIDDSLHSEMLLSRILDGSSLVDIEMVKLGQASVLISTNELRL